MNKKNVYRVIAVNKTSGRRCGLALTIHAINEEDALAQVREHLSHQVDEYEVNEHVMLCS